MALVWEKKLWIMSRMRFMGLLTLVIIAQSTILTRAQLSSSFYDSSCPGLQSIVRSQLSNALNSDGRVGASLLRMHFHDCFVQGCDGSVLLDDNSTFTGEKTAGPNINSLRGFDVIDNIKTAVESSCRATVSCADILALVARDAVVAAGGPSWSVQFGRRDSQTASFSGASGLPSPVDDVSTLTSKFASKGLSQTDMVALSGAHTFGKAQCFTFSQRLYNFNGGGPDPTIDPTYLSKLQAACPQGGSGSTLVDLDQGTPATFDNSYYANLLNNKGLLTSDQTLQSEGGSTAGAVNFFGGSQNQFFAQFSNSMVSMGNISPLTGSKGTIRTNCRVAN